jgi:hypothetical protein
MFDIISDMEYHFSVAWFVAGLLVTIAGGLFMQYHQWVADNFGGGLGSYDKYKLAATIMVVTGLVFMINIHTTLLAWFFGLLFNGLANG